jgi:hypothetical protein
VFPDAHHSERRVGGYKRKRRALVWAAERDIRERDSARDDGGGGIVKGADSRGAGTQISCKGWQQEAG